jgi:hypothetical protein
VRAAVSGFADAAVRYRRFRGERSLNVDGRFYGASYTQPRAAPLWGGDLRATATTDVGRRSNLDVSVHGTSDPFMMLGAFSPVRRDLDLADVPDANPTLRVSNTRSWSANAAASLRHRWNSRNTAVVGYTFDRREYAAGLGYDTSGHSAQFGYDRGLNRTWAFATAYRYSNVQTLVPPSYLIPLEQHGAEIGLRYTKRLSTSQTVSVSFGAGATHAEAARAVAGVRLEDWLPTGYGGVALFLGRTWALRADYRRAVAVISGLTPYAYATDVIYVSGGGAAGGRADLVVSGAFASGQPGLDPAAAGAFVDYTGMAQFRYAFSSWCGAVANYTYYRHRLTDSVEAPTMWPGSLERQLVQVGLTVAIPLRQPRVPRAGREPASGS